MGRQAKISKRSLSMVVTGAALAALTLSTAGGQADVAGSEIRLTCTADAVADPGQRFRSAPNVTSFKWMIEPGRHVVTGNGASWTFKSTDSQYSWDVKRSNTLTEHVVIDRYDGTFVWEMYKNGQLDMSLAGNCTIVKDPQKKF